MTPQDPATPRATKKAPRRPAALPPQDPTAPSIPTAPHVSAVVQAAPLESSLPEQLDMKSLFEALLRRPHALIPRLADSNHKATRLLAAMAAASFLLFGLVLGCFAKHEQLWAAPIKITGGLLIAGVICFPSLYIFATLAGARIALAQLLACLTGSLALAGLLLLGFAPAIWIFAESTDSFGFMGMLSIGAWLIALWFALRFIKSVVAATGGTQKGPMFVWSFVFLLVTLQMTTSLRPILGRSQAFLTSEKMFFLQHWYDCVGTSLEGKPDAVPAPQGTPRQAPAGKQPQKQP